MVYYGVNKNKIPHLPLALLTLALSFVLKMLVLNPCLAFTKLCYSLLA